MYTESELRAAVKDSLSCGETLTRLGRQRTGTSYTCLRNNIEKYNIDTSHFTRRLKSKTTGKLHHSDILTFDPNREIRRKTFLIVRALLEAGVSHSCKECGVSKIWNSKPLVLEVDHIDGNWKNDRLENLRFLCPNCHSQQKTSKKKKMKYYCECGCLKSKYANSCSKCSLSSPRPNARKVSRPSLEALQKDVKELGYSGTGRKYGVSDNAVRKWIKAYNEPD